MKHNKKAFTLIELLIVILIIGILATIAIVSYNGATARAKRVAALQMMNDTAQAIEVCLSDNNATLKADNQSGNILRSYDSKWQGKKICTGDITSATWPKLDSGDMTLNGYSDYTGDAMWWGNNHTLALIVSDQGVLWGQNETLNSPEKNHFDGPSDDIVCTFGGCK